jgi:hypothetical protein
MRQKLVVNEGLYMAMLFSGLLMVPIMGWLPFIEIAAVCGVSVYAVNLFNSRR